MQFLADIIKRLNENGLISREMLYNMKESEIINIIESSKYGDIFNIWKTCKKVKKSLDKKDVYCINHGAKVRYIDPLVNGKRISTICKIAKKMIDKNLSYDMNGFIYIDNIVF
jgi:hypothetical protein